MNPVSLMSRQQVAQAHDVLALWSTYGPALRTKLAHAGGMTWKTVRGAQYLCRYWQDERTGKKKFTSLGRRSPDTEATYREFMDARAMAIDTVSSNSAAMTLTGRLSKAHGLARMPSRNARMLRAFWLGDLMDERLVLLGGTALYAYETDAGVLVPQELTREVALTFLARVDIDEDLVDDVRAAHEEVTGTSPMCSWNKQKVSIEGNGHLPVIVIRADWVLDRFEARSEEQIEILQDAFQSKAMFGVVTARDSRPVEVKAPDPRAYAIIAYALCRLDDQDIDCERARFAAALVRELWPAKFDPRQEAAFPALCEGTHDEEARLREP